MKTLGLLFITLLILVVRPVSVLLALWGTKTTMPERIFLGFLAPRGIVAASVASVFGLKLASLDPAADPGGVFEKAELLVPVTFLTILGTVLVCGLGASPLARRLGLSDANPPADQARTICTNPWA